MTPAGKPLSPAAASVLPAVSGQNDYSARLLDDAGKAYPFIKQYSPVVSVGKGEGYAETWAADEPGDKDYPRPAEFPMGKVGVQVFRPNDFKPADLAAEFLHVDPKAKAARETLLKSMSSDQIERLKSQSADYKESRRMGQSEDRALQNAVDSAMRGYTTGQWPKEANDRMAYTDKQRKVLDDLKTYMVTGK